VTTALLRSLIAEEGPARPLALRALAEREPGAAVVRRYIDHPDPLLRAHVARGLGDGGGPGAVGLLARRFEFEVDPSVRLAIVYALAVRRGSAADRTLSIAAQLDADDAVRSAARLALRGTPLGDPPPRGELLWVELRHAREAESPLPSLPPGGSGLDGAEALPRGAGAKASESPDQAEVRNTDHAGSEREAKPAPPAASAGALLNVAPGLAFPVFAGARGALIVAGVGLRTLGIRLL
jgi:hypothetical protein